MFLIRASFTQYQDAHVRGCDQSYLAVYFTEIRTLALVNGHIFPLYPLLQDFQERKEVVSNQLFEDTVLRAQLHWPHGSRYFVIVDLDDIRIVPALFPQFFQQDYTISVGLAQISQYHVVFLHLGKYFPCAPVSGGADALELLAFQQVAYKVGIYEGVLNDDYSAHRSASFLAKATISRPCVNTTFTTDCISLSAMASLWTASYNIANGYSAFINIHEFLRWCTHPSIAFISLASALCTSFMSVCVVAASFSSVCRLLPKASSGERSMWLTCFCPMLYSVQ